MRSTDPAVHLVILFMGTASMAACGGDDRARNPGASDGSADARAGEGGSASDAGGADGASTSCLSPCMPECLAALLRTCERMGECMFEVTKGPPEALGECCSNGVRTCSSYSGATEVTTVTRGDGTVCFTLESRYESAGNVTVTFRDGAGSVVATMSASQADRARATVMCGGLTYDVDSSKPECKGRSGCRNSVEGTCNCP